MAADADEADCVAKKEKNNLNQKSFEGVDLWAAARTRTQSIQAANIQKWNRRYQGQQEKRFPDTTCRAGILL
jgi:hypothetical protein